MNFYLYILIGIICVIVFFAANKKFKFITKQNTEIDDTILPCIFAGLLFLWPFAIIFGIIISIIASINNIITKNLPEN